MAVFSYLRLQASSIANRWQSKHAALQAHERDEVVSVDLEKFKGSLPEAMELKEFTDDPYRGILYFCRGIGWEKPVDTPATGLPFLEFYWAEEIQEGIASGNTQLDLHTPKSPYNLAELSDYTKAVKAICEWIIGLPPGEPIGTSGFTAAQMGQGKKFGQKDFDLLIDASETANGKPKKTLKPKASDEPDAKKIGELPKPGKWAYAWANRYAADKRQPAPPAPTEVVPAE